MESPVTH